MYLAPAGFDVTVAADRTVSLRRAEREHAIPSIDRLFESAAAVYRDRLAAVALTGCGTDGARGTVAVRSHGGLVIAQDPVTSAFASMPRAAIAGGAVDLVLPLADIAPTLAALAGPRTVSGAA